jgi:hypothetical protein
VNRYYWENAAVLILAIGIAVVPLFSLPSGGTLIRGASIAFAALFISKGVARARCHLSDVFLTMISLIGVLTLIFVHMANEPRWVLEIALLIAALIFATTGLTFKQIARQQKAKKL